MNQNKTILIRDKDGKEKEATIVTIISLEETKKTYLIYTLNEKDQNGLVIQYASTFIKGKDQYTLADISDEEWNLIKKKMHELVKTGEGCNGNDE